MPHSIRYEVDLNQYFAHLYKISCTIPTPDPNGQFFSLPTWILGSYLIREFSKNMTGFSASCQGQKLHHKKTDKNHWWVEPCQGPLQVSYEVYAFDSSIRASFLDNFTGYINGPSVFLKCHGFENSPCAVTIQKPNDLALKDWRLYTALLPLESDQKGFGTYQARDYAELLDSPIQMGNLKQVDFLACQIPHQMVLWGEAFYNNDFERLGRDLQSLCKAHIELFAQPAPFDRYLFITRLEEGTYGGLEHRNSTMLLSPPNVLPKKGIPEVSPAYRSFLGLCSHEYFHAWNVKSIKPKAFLEADLNEESYTGLLWAFEGITSYYDDLMLLRAGLINQKSYLELLARAITILLRTPGRKKQSLEESSFDAWIKFYRPDENSSNSTVSYYIKGSIVALVLDLWIRKQTGNAKSLDDVMRYLYQQYGRLNKGLEEQEWEAVAETVTGLSLGSFFDQTIRGTDDLALASIFKEVGIEYKVRPQDGESDLGGKPPSTSMEKLLQRPYVGAKWNTDLQGVSVKQVLIDSPAALACLCANDILVAIDNRRITPNNWSTLLSEYRAGEVAKISYFRRQVLRQTELRFTSPPNDTCELILKNDVDDSVKEMREKWLQGRE